MAQQFLCIDNALTKHKVAASTNFNILCMRQRQPQYVCIKQKLTPSIVDVDAVASIVFVIVAVAVLLRTDSLAMF